MIRMYFDINKYIFIFIGWLLRMSYQLDCLQCTGPIRRATTNWDHSCLDGTLKALPCSKSENASEQIYQQCVSALYRVGQRGIAGVMINRHCTHGDKFRHDCDPIYVDLEKPDMFYCSFTCSGNGCNRHSVEDILDYNSSTRQCLKTNYHVAFIFISYLIIRCNLLS